MKLDLTGDGSVYIRVSDDQQDVQRQYAAIRAFEQRHGVAIAKQNWLEDEGWARDTAAVRPGFLRLMKLAEAGVIKWIVVSERDRFGTTDADQFIHFRYQLRQWGCRLYDANGTDWTKKDIATVITAVVDGEKSEQEQHSISKRALGGMVEKARRGEYQGGAVRLGFDIGCFDRAANRELWRVILEARDRRVKVFPEGRTERFDGKGNFPKCAANEVLRLTPSTDKAKVQAAVSVFERYAAESISFTALAHFLNSLGMVSCYGQPFESRSVEDMLADPIYLGYATWNKLHQGKFHRHQDGRPVLELNYGRKQTKNHKNDWVQSDRLFDPLVPLSVWNQVQEKLMERKKRAKAPHSHRHYLAGLVVCAGCEKPMIAGHGNRAGSGRYEYQCGTYSMAVRYKRTKPVECKCLRNGVFQDELESYIDRYLEETGKRLVILMEDAGHSHLTGRLEEQELGAWRGYTEGLTRLCEYLRDYHPDEYAAVFDANPPRGAFNHLDRIPGVNGDVQAETAPVSADVRFASVADLLHAYRQSFDPTAIDAELTRLDAEHTALTRACMKLETPRARAKANKQLAEIEEQMNALERQKEDSAAIVEGHYKQLRDLQTAIEDAQRAMSQKEGERAIRQKAEAIRRVVQRIDCTFAATGVTGHGPGKRASKLVKVTIHPLVGEPLTYKTDNVTSPESGSPPERNMTLRRLLTIAYVAA